MSKFAPRRTPLGAWVLTPLGARKFYEETPAGDAWFFATLGVGGINPEYTWGLTIYELGDVSGDYSAATYANIASDWLAAEWPRDSVQYFSDTSFDPSSLSLSCSSVSTPDGYTVTVYAPAGVHSDNTPTTGTILVRQTSDDALIRTFEGMSECDSVVYNPPPVLQAAWGYVPA